MTRDIHPYLTPRAEIRLNLDWLAAGSVNGVIVL